MRGLRWAFLAIGVSVGVVSAAGQMPESSYWREWSSPSVLLALGASIYAFGMSGEQLKRVGRDIEQMRDELKEVKADVQQLVIDVAVAAAAAGVAASQSVGHGGARRKRSGGGHGGHGGEGGRNGSHGSYDSHDSHGHNDPDD